MLNINRPLSDLAKKNEVNYILTGNLVIDTIIFITKWYIT